MKNTRFARRTTQLASYGVIGVLATAVHFTVMAGLLRESWMPVSASTAGAIGGALVAYAANRKWTFNARHSSARMLRFMAVAAMGVLLNAVFLTVFQVWSNGSIIAAQLATTALVFFATFVINLKWSFA